MAATKSLPNFSAHHDIGILSTSGITNHQQAAVVVVAGTLLTPPYFGMDLSVGMEGDDLWDGFDFDSTKDIDWGAMDMTEEECLAINFPTGLVGKCGSFESINSTDMNNTLQQKSGKRPLSVKEDEQLDKAAKHECFSRILVTTRAASSHWDGNQKVATGFRCPNPSTLISQSPDLLAVTELRKTISMKLLGAMNQGDMDRLALLIHDYCDDYCELVTTCPLVHSIPSILPHSYQT